MKYHANLHLFFLHIFLQYFSFPTGSYYKKWDEDEEDTDVEDEEETLNQATVTLTKASEILLLLDNEKSRLLENFLKRHFFRDLLEVSSVIFLLCAMFSM